MKFPVNHKDMNLLQLQNSIEDLMTAFVLRVRSAAALGKTDINKVSETILIPLFREVYGYTNLKNLNNTEGDNYPGKDTNGFYEPTEEVIAFCQKLAEFIE